MATPVNNGTTSTGRSPDAEEIYNQYVTYYNAINGEINAVDQLPASSNNQSVRAQLIALQQQLYPIYQSCYNNGSATLGTFVADCASIEAEVSQLSASVTSGEPSPVTPPVTNPSPITVYSASQRSPDASQIYQQYLSYYAGINTMIEGIDALPAAERGLASVQQDRASLISLQAQLEPIYENQYNSSSATLATYIAASASLEAEATSVYNAAVNATVTPPPVTPPVTPPPVSPVTPVSPVAPAPAPSAFSIQNGTWYLDWTSYNYPIPQGVNAVDIFVGNMSLGANGNPSVGGFGTLSQNPATLAAFIQGCKAKGITVNISLGGSGGSYDNTWDV